MFANMPVIKNIMIWKQLKDVMKIWNDEKYLMTL